MKYGDKKSKKDLMQRKAAKKHHYILTRLLYKILLFKTQETGSRKKEQEKV
jgi:hypothetical protein